MKKLLYIIPGWQEHGNDAPYQQLANAAQEKGYEVVCPDVDWRTPLSQQIFPVTQDSVVFGFSLGAILARLVAQQHPCRHLILASMTPDHNFINPEIKKALVDLVGKEFVDDIIGSLASTNQAEKQTTLYGELEKEPADILVLHTEHELNDAYIKEIVKLL